MERRFLIPRLMSRIHFQVARFSSIRAYRFNNYSRTKRYSASTFKYRDHFFRNNYSHMNEKIFSRRIYLFNFRYSIVELPLNFCIYAVSTVSSAIIIRTFVNERTEYSPIFERSRVLHTQFTNEKIERNRVFHILSNVTSSFTIIIRK